MKVYVVTYYNQDLWHSPIILVTHDPDAAYRAAEEYKDANRDTCVHEMEMGVAYP